MILNETVLYQVYTTAKDDYGTPVKTWSTGTNKTVNIQPANATPEQLSTWGFRDSKVYRCFSDVGSGMSKNNRIVRATGQELTIVQDNIWPNHDEFWMIENDGE